VILAFGDHRLDIERRELRCGGDIIDLEPKAFDLLVFLVEHRERVVTKTICGKGCGADASSPNRH
jgi:DNA-binding winged helix-turn-helix (wHTH) protein